MNDKVKLIAFYLPQFYPTEINDNLHGKGFTEWRSVASAKPLYPGHWQPHIPADLGFYDLRLSEVREAQATMAKKYGIDGFCYWHYWLGNGVEFLEKPVQEIMRLKKPDFPFCLGWANHDWKTNHLIYAMGKTVIKQEYPGEQDYINHFYSVLPCFQDKRYIRIDDKPVFIIYSPLAHKDIPQMIRLWQKLAKQNGLKGIYFIGHCVLTVTEKNPVQDYFATGVDAVNLEYKNSLFIKRANIIFRVLEKIVRIAFHIPHIVSYKKAEKYFVPDVCKEENIYPVTYANWDNTPRTGCNGMVLTGSSPSAFKKHLRRVFDLIKHKSAEHQIIFIKSWNEWAEGNYLEPDTKFGYQWLEAIKEIKENN